MTTWNLRGTYVVQSLLVIALGLFLPLKPTEALASEKEDHESKYLFIRAGDQTRTAPDFLAVINFDDDSKDYGKVIASVPFPAPDAPNENLRSTGVAAIDIPAEAFSNAQGQA